MSGHLGTALLHLLIRPDVPLGQDVGRVVGGALCLIAAVGLWACNENDSAMAAVPFMPALQTISLCAMIGLTLLLAVLAARLFWKIDYLQRMHDTGDHGGP